MEKYIEFNTNNVYNNYTRILNEARHNLRKSYWKEGTKPQNKQLDTVQKATVELENLFEDYIYPHIKVLRKFNIHCNMTLECLNGIQSLRKVGVLGLLKRYYPDLGKNIEPPIKKGGTFLSSGEYVDSHWGIYLEDWRWAQLGPYIAKANIANIVSPMTAVSIDTVNKLGHAHFELRSNQSSFDRLAELQLKTRTERIPKATKLSSSKPKNTDTFGNIQIHTSDNVVSSENIYSYDTIPPKHFFATSENTEPPIQKEQIDSVIKSDAFETQLSTDYELWLQKMKIKK